MRVRLEAAGAALILRAASCLSIKESTVALGVATGLMKDHHFADETCMVFGQAAPAATHSLRTAMSESASLSVGGITRRASWREMARMRRSSFKTEPRRPPFSSASRESSRRPERATVGPWQLQQFFSRIRTACSGAAAARAADRTKMRRVTLLGFYQVRGGGRLLYPKENPGRDSVDNWR